MGRNLKNSKTGISTMILVAVVVVIVVVGAAVGAYYFMSQNPAGSSDTNPTTTPSGTTDPTTSTPTSVADATSLKYSVSLTENGVETASYTYWGKNAGTENFAMRIEYTDESDDGILIFNSETNEAWTYSGGEWVDISSYFDSQFDMWENLWTGYVNSLESWAGTGEYTYSADGNTVRIYDISVNPTLEDSLFTHS